MWEIRSPHSRLSLLNELGKVLNRRDIADIFLCKYRNNVVNKETPLVE
jgi:hypothetical protein